MRAPAPDPAVVRTASVDELRRLRLPVPTPNFPLVWALGDAVEVRRRRELEERAAILNVILARSFGMPSQVAMQWLLGARLVDRLTQPEWHFVVAGQGDYRSFALHLEALYGLAWLLGLTKHLDPAEPSEKGLARRFPDLRSGEPFDEWRGRALTAVREPADAAAMLDLYYCLDWAYLEAERRRQRLPGLIDSNTIGQRRWALEWAVICHGPHHGPPPSWEEVDLST